MKIKVSVCFFLSIFMIFGNLIAQNPITAKGTKLIMGLGSYSSTKNTDDKSRSTLAAITGSYDYFYLKNCFIGINAGASNSTYMSGSGSTETSFRTAAIGPEFGRTFTLKSNITPLLLAGVLYQRSGSETFNTFSSYNLFGAAGVIIPFNQKLGVIMQAKYEYRNYITKIEDTSALSHGNETVFSLNFGFVGIFN